MLHTRNRVRATVRSASHKLNQMTTTLKDSGAKMHAFYGIETKFPGLSETQEAFMRKFTPHMRIEMLG